MIVLIAGATHTGKTVLSQRLLEKYKFPYLSIDHIKMGLIRSNLITLNVIDDTKLTQLLWPLVKEIIKTAVENNQSMIIERCYIPFDWKKDFTDEYLSQIKYYCLVMSAEYIENNFAKICEYENAVEKRLQSGGIDKKELIKDNLNNLQLCKKYGLNYILIDKDYDIKIEL